MLTHRLEDKIITNYSGYNQLSRFHNFCLSKPPKSRIYLDFTDVEWIDGNLCALLLAMVYHLNKTFGHIITTSEEIIKERFDVLYRNGFMNAGTPVKDDRNSTIPIRAFNSDDKVSFCKYIENDLLMHRGMPADLTPELKEKINEDLLEVFCNTQFHANTKDPFFVGGQYFPKQGFLRFTMVDLGDGFFPRISKATSGEIKNDVEAILWALQGNSSKIVLEDCPGGLGIKNILKYCKKSNGILQIISGNGFWSSDLENTIFEKGRELPVTFIGTTINLSFKKLL
jgi:hypothetical protein